MAKARKENKCESEGGNMKPIIDDFLGKIRQHHYATYQHCIRTTQITSMISDSLRLSNKDKHYLIVAAILHDLGKVNIPTEILNSPNKLQHYEWMIIKQHPVYGANMLKHYQIYDDVVSGIMSHHERFDGLGYPNNLIGEEIPWQGRIIAIADSLDAMVSYRHYRKEKTLNQALQEIWNMKGVQFDPYIVNKFSKWDKVSLGKILYTQPSFNLGRIII
jgi:putative nucleotidyltransferase with HDIG domain